MKNEENVCGETTLTEEVKTVDVGGEEQKHAQEASAVLGKFKNVDALAQAYEALQAEFTRRSQRLKALEKQAENFKVGGVDALGVEKLRKNAKAKREENKRFDLFMADVASEKVAEKPVLHVLEEAPVGVGQEEESAVKADSVENVAFVENTPKDEQVNVVKGEDFDEKDFAFGNKVLVNEEEPMMKKEAEMDEEKVRVGNTAREKMEMVEGSVVVNEPVLSSEGLYEKVQGDEQVRLRIIGEYLSSIGKSGAPVTCGNHGIFAAPPLRAKTIADAGGMALQYFKTTSRVEK